MPFLRRNLIARGSRRQRSRNTGSQDHLSKRARVALALVSDSVNAFSGNTIAGASAHTPSSQYPKSAQPSASTANQSKLTATNGSMNFSDSSSALILTDLGAVNVKPSAILLSSVSSKSIVPLRSEINAAQNPTHLPRAFFHYLFMQPNNVPATIVEEIDGRICPLCNYDGKNNEDLLSHCVIYHGTLQNHQHDNSCEIMASNVECAYFEAALGEESQLHVIVRGVPTRSSHMLSTNCIHDKFVYIRPQFNSQSLVEQQLRITFLKRSRDKVASLDSGARSKRLLALQSNDAPASVISAYLPTDTVPIRQYYHSHTNLPMTTDEWMEDSDEDIDEKWVQEMSSELLDEFEDVAAEEKQFMTLWNRFIKSAHVIGDRDMPGKCHAFVLKHRTKLIDAGLRMQLLLHLFHLWDSGVISSNRIHQCMELCDGNKNNPMMANESV